MSGQHVVRVQIDQDRPAREASCGKGSEVSGAGRVRYLTLAEAAAYLNVSERYLRRAVGERKVRHRRVGKFLRFDVDDLDDLARVVEVDEGASELADRIWFSARRLG